MHDVRRFRPFKSVSLFLNNQNYYMNSQILESLKWRYATKKFDPKKKLSAEKLSVLKETFNLTATSYGLQPLKMLVITNDKLKEKLVPLSFNQLQVRDASHVLVLCIDTFITANFIKDHFKRVENLQETDRAILEPFEEFLIGNFENKSASEIKAWMINQLYLIFGALLTACAVEEIDSCPIEGFESEKYDELLNLKEKNLESILVLPIGYRAEDDMFANLKKVRRGTEELIYDIN